MLKYLPRKGINLKLSTYKDRFKLIIANFAFHIVLLYLIFPQTAYAYLDPGSGSFILQLIIGVLFGLLLAGKVFWRKVKIFFKNLFSRKKKNED